MSDHHCPDDPMGAMFRGDDGPYLDCSPEVDFDWDQWMECSIRCNHGTFVGVACAVNFAESFAEAVEKFNAYDHVGPTPVRAAGEEWADYMARLNTVRETVVEFCDAHSRRIHPHGHDYDPMRQGAVFNVDVHDDDGSRCTPVNSGLVWDAEFAVDVSYCLVSDTGKRIDVATTAHLRIQYWHRHWDNNLRLCTQEIGRQAKAGEPLHEPDEGWWRWSRKILGY